MNKPEINEPENNEGIILSAIESVAFFLFAVLSDCYPELSTPEFENIFNEEFKIDVVEFVKNYRKNAGNRITMSGKDFSQAYSNQRFYEKLSRALEQCKKDKAVPTVTNHIKDFLA